MSCLEKNKCGGCFYINETYDEELKIKEKFVLDTLQDYIGESEVEQIIASPFFSEYKNKMEFSFGDNVKGGALLLGLHEKRSFFNICSAVNCELVCEDVREVIKLTENYFREHNVKYRHKKSMEGLLRYLVVRRSYAYNKLLVNLVTAMPNSNEEKLILEWAELIQKLNVQLFGICHTVSDTMSDAVVYNNNIKVLYGQDYLEEKLFDLKFKVSLPSFFQTNTYGAEKLYSKVKEYLCINENDLANKLDILYDLYCGTGTIAQVLSNCAKKVIGIEIIEDAIKVAKENSEFNNIHNIDFIACDVLDFCENNKSKLINSNGNSAIILDPPRSGINIKALDVISQMNSKKIVYVSCKCESLKRDLLMLVGRGYKLKKVCPIDMFPRTNNVETVALLERD